MNIEQMAEIKGYLCGFICSGIQSEGKSWLETLEGGLQGLDIVHQRNMLIELYKQTSEDFLHERLGFGKTIFDKSFPLAIRVSVFRKWCQGFLAGIEQTGLPMRQLLTAAPDFKEKLHYFEGIMRLDTTNIEISEADEKMFIQITELLEKMVLEIYRVLHQTPPKH